MVEGLGMRLSLGVVVVGLTGLAVIVVGVLVGAVVARTGATAPTASSASVAAIAPEPAAPVPKEEAPTDRMAAMRYTQAFAYARPLMGDAVEKDSEGAVLFAAWATKHAVWGDFSVQSDETTFALVQKDSPGAIGKRLCTTGSVVEIHVDHVEGLGPMSEGLTQSYSGNLFRFLAVGSTGALVSGSAARFCGVVIGNYDYSNSGGGVGHAVSLVGMFDLPQNRPTAPPNYVRHT
jgi:hypothetical protein